MTLDNLYDLNENDIKKLVIFDVNKFKELEKEQEQNFEELKKQEQYEKNSDKLTKTMVSRMNSIQNTIMNISKKQEELKNKIDVLREDYEKFTSFNEKIEDYLSTLYELKQKKESLDKDSSEFNEIEKQEEELNTSLSSNQRQLKILVANFVELNKDEMNELLEKEAKDEKEQNEVKEETKEEAKEEEKEETKDEEKNKKDNVVLEIKEFSMPKYNYDDLMSIYEENMKNLLMKQDDIISSINEIDEYIDNYDENAEEDDELEEKKEEKESLEEEQDNISQLIKSLELIKTSILEIKEKQEQIEDLNTSISDILKKIEEQRKIIDDESIEDTDDSKIEARKELNKLIKEKNELVKSKNSLIKQINSIGKDIDEDFKNKFEKTKNAKKVKHNNFSRNNFSYEPANYSYYVPNAATNTPSQEVGEAQPTQERIFTDEEREKADNNSNNLPVKSSKDIILDFISKIHNSQDNGEEFLNKNFNGIVTSLIYEQNLKNLTKQDRKDLGNALNKHEEEVCNQIGKLDASNVDAAMYELFLDDMDSFRMYKDTQENLFKGLYSSNLDKEISIKEIGDISKLDEKSIEFLNTLFSTYYKKLENGDLKEDSDIYKCINRLIVSPVKLSVIKKYNKNIQSRFSYMLSKIKVKFMHKTCNKESLEENLKNTISYGEELKSKGSKNQNDSLGIKSMVNDEKDIAKEGKNTVTRETRSNDTLTI